MTIQSTEDRRMLVTNSNISALCLPKSQRFWNGRGSLWKLDPTTLTMNLESNIHRSLIEQVMKAKALPRPHNWQPSLTVESRQSSFVAQFRHPACAATVLDVLDGCKLSDVGTSHWLDVVYLTWSSTLRNSGLAQNEARKDIVEYRFTEHSLSTAPPRRPAARPRSASRGRSSRPHRRSSEGDGDGYASGATHASKRSHSVYRRKLHQRVK